MRGGVVLYSADGIKSAAGSSARLGNRNRKVNKQNETNAQHEMTMMRDLCEPCREAVVIKRTVKQKKTGNKPRTGFLHRDSQQIVVGVGAHNEINWPVASARCCG
jgi:hypothetical protein